MAISFYFVFYLFIYFFFQDKSEQSRNASDSIIQNLKEKIADMENRVRKPSVESTEEVIRLRTSQAPGVGANAATSRETNWRTGN